QLEDAADLLLDADRDRHQGLGAVLDRLVDARVETGVARDVGGEVGLAGRVDVAGDAAGGGDGAAEQLARVVAEGGDEVEVVVTPLGQLVDGVVEEDRAGGRGDE